MLRIQPVMKTVLTLVLSATMALPTTSVARNDSIVQPGVTEDVPVFAQELEINGQWAMVFAMPIDADKEHELVTSLAKSRPENSVLMVSGPADPALKAAASSGYWRYLKTYLVGQPDQAPITQQLEFNFGLKDKLLRKLKAVTSAAKSDTAVGLYFGLVYAGIQGGFTGYASSSVDAGLAVFSMFALWNSFVLTKPQYWGRALHYGGRGATAIGERVASLVGVELSERDKRLFEVVGKFAVSWGVTVAQAGFVKQWSGDFEGLSGWRGIAEGFADAGMSGVQNNYNIWDAAVLKSNAEGGYFTEKRTKWYFRWQMVVGSVLEALAFRGVPYVGLFLTAVTAGGAVYLALNPEKQVMLGRKAMKFNVSFRSGVAYISNPEQHRSSQRNFGRHIAGRVKRAAQACSDFLVSSPSSAIHYHPRLYTDTQ